MRRTMTSGIAAAILALAFPLNVLGGEVVLAGWSNTARISHVDPWTGREWFRGPFRNDFQGFVAQDVTALATDPITRDVYVVFDTDELFHRLVRYDGRTFRATDIGNLGEFIVGLAFDANGTLYGITSDDVQGTTDTIFTINTQTAALTFFMNTPGPDAFNDTIAYNSDDGKLYHSNGFPGSFNAIDLGTKAVTAIGYPPSWPASVGILSFSYDSVRGVFVGYRQQEFGGGEEYFTLSTSGVQTALAAGTFSAEAITFLDEPPLVPAPAPPASGRFLYGVDANVNLVSQVDPATGADIGAIGVSLDGVAVSGFNGIATDPTNGEIYAVARLDQIAERLIVKIDPATGTATTIGDTGDAIAAIAFDNAGTLYAITGDNATAPSTLFTVDKADGTLTEFLVIGADGGGEAIAYNPDDGKMYRFSGNTDIEAIDLQTKAITAITLTNDTTPTGAVSAAVYDEQQGVFLAMRWAPDGPLFYSVTTAGVQTTIGTTGPSKGFAFSLAPAPAAALSTPALFESGSVSGEGTWAAITRDSATRRYHAEVRRVSDAGSVADIDLGTDYVIDVAAIDNADPGQDSILAVLVVDSASTPKVRTYRLSDGVLLKTVNILQSDWEVSDLVSLDDSNADGIEEYAALGRNSSTGENAAQVRSGENGAFIKNVFFLNSSWQPRQLIALPNFAGGSAAELGMLATNDPGQIVVMVKDAGTNAFIRNVFYLNSNWSPQEGLQIESFNMNSASEIGLSAVNDGSGQIVVMVKDAGSNTFLNNVFPLSSNFDLTAGLIVPDETGNSVQEYAALGANKGSGKLIIQLRDASTGAFIRNLAPLGSNWSPGSFLFYDLGAGTRFVILAERKSDGLIVVQTIDAATGAVSNNVFIN